MTDSIERFIFHCEYEKNLSEKTIKAYKIDLSQFSEYMLKTDILAITFIDRNILRAYIKILFDNSYKETTIKRKIATMKAFFSYLENEEVIENNPFGKLKLKIKEPIRHPKTISLHEIKQLLKFMYKNKELCRKKESYAYKRLVMDIVVIEVLFATGMRVAEICGLKKENINLREDSVAIIGKGNKERTVHLCGSYIKPLLKEYMTLFANELIDADGFFVNRLGKNISEQSVRFMIKKYCKEAKIKTHITPHMFRHSMATFLLEAGVDIRYIQNILGHSSIATTQIYTKINPSHQKKIVATKHPRRLFDLM